MTTVTLNLSEVLIGLLIIAGIVLLIYMTVAVARLLPGLKSLSSLLKDAETLVGDAKNGVADLKETAGKISTAVGGLADDLTAKKGLSATLSSAIRTVTSIIAILREREDREYEKKRRAFERERAERK